MNGINTKTLHSLIKHPHGMKVASVAICLLLSSPTLRGQSPPPIYEGFTEPRFDIMVAATEIGRLEEVSVEVGDLVQQGQTIARLEDSLQASAVKIAELQAEMQGETDAARAEAFLHTTRRDQLRELAEKQMARPNELMRAEADLKIAAAREVAAIEQHQLRQAELERYQIQLARRRVTAPMAGVISKIFHHPGEYITPGDPAVVRLLVIDQLFAVFNVPAEETPAFKTGADVEVFLRSTSKTVPGRVHSVAPDIDGESGTVRVKIALSNQDSNLRVGDRCTMQLGRARKQMRRASVDKIFYSSSKSR